MFWLLWLLVKAILCLITLCIFYACFKHFNTMRQSQFYTEQGISKLRAFDTFFLGNAVLMAPLAKLVKKHTEENLKPTKPALSWLLDQHDLANSFDCDEHPVMQVNLGAMLVLFV